MNHIMLLLFKIGVSEIVGFAMSRDIRPYSISYHGRHHLKHITKRH